MVGTPCTLGRWSTSGLMNSGAVVHSFTRRAYSSSIACLGWPIATVAARMKSAITGGILMGLLYTITLHAALWEIVMSAGGYNGMRISTWMMAAALLGSGVGSVRTGCPDL